MSQYQIKKLWGDEEIGGRLYLQTIELIDAVQLTGKEQKDAIWKVMAACMHKLTIVKYHHKQYEHWEKAKFANARARLKKAIKQKQQPDVHEEFEMISELEAFLHQVKSSLDMLAKLLIHAADLGKGATSTFGDNGDRLIKKLRNSQLYKVGHKEKIEDLVSLIETEQTAWLKAIVNLRDAISHWQGLSGLVFQFQNDPIGQLVLYPLIDGRRIPEFLQLIQQNLIEFHQDFIALAFRIKFHPGLELIPLDPKCGEKKYNSPTGKYVKWGIGMKMATNEATTT